VEISKATISWKKHWARECYFGPMTAIVGWNGVGKTSILEALRWAFTDSPSRGLSSYVPDGKGGVRADLTFGQDETLKRSATWKGKRLGKSEPQICGLDGIPSIPTADWSELLKLSPKALEAILRRFPADAKALRPRALTKPQMAMLDKLLASTDSGKLDLAGLLELAPILRSKKAMIGKRYTAANERVLGLENKDPEEQVMCKGCGTIKAVADLAIRANGSRVKIEELRANLATVSSEITRITGELVKGVKSDVNAALRRYAPDGFELKMRNEKAKFSWEVKGPGDEQFRGLDICAQSGQTSLLVALTATWGAVCGFPLVLLDDAELMGLSGDSITGLCGSMEHARELGQVDQLVMVIDPDRAPRVPETWTRIEL
jgi:hypothetical protein